MKKNYLAHLKQYDAKTSLRDKQSHYRRTFIKTCYNTADKQNEDPNVTSKRSRINSKSEKQNARKDMLHDTKSTEKKDDNLEEGNRQRSVTEFREINISPYECEVNRNHNADILYLVEGNRRKIICCEECSLKYLNKTIFFQQFPEQIGAAKERKRAILTRIKLQSVNLQRQISKQEVEQTEKCKQYYQALQKELNFQEDSIIQLINSSFAKSIAIIEAKILKITELIENLDEDALVEPSPRSKKYCTSLCPQETQVQLEMITILLNQQIFQKARSQLKQFDLRNLGFLHNQFKDNFEVQSQQLTKESAQNQSLSCSQQFIDPKNTQQIKGLLNISFEQGFTLGESPIIEQEVEQSCSISPSFKYF